MRSPLLDLPDAVAAEGVDLGVAAHYGSFHTEQRTLVSGEGFVDLSHRDVIRVAGADRLGWLHSLTTQDFQALPAGQWTTALVLSPHGHVEHAFAGYDDGAGFVAHTEPGRGAALVEFLDSMKFVMRVEVTEVSDELAVTWRPRGAQTRPDMLGGYQFVPREQLPTYADAAGPACGLWAFEALRIACGVPRLGLDTDRRTIPNETGWIGSAVHLDKGCYRGQETVARVHNLGRPPRRLTLLHLDGTENRLPAVGADLTQGDTVVGFVGSSARHYELGPIALGMVKRSVPLTAQVAADALPATQEVLVDPEAGLHLRPLR